MSSFTNFTVGSSLPEGMMPEENILDPETIKSDWAIGVIWCLLNKTISVSALTLQKAAAKMNSPPSDDEEADQELNCTEERNDLSEPLRNTRRSNGDKINLLCCSVTPRVFWYTVGICLYICAQPLGILALTFAPIAIIGPLGGLEVVLGMLMSWFFLKEPFSKQDVIATFILMFSAIGVICFGPHNGGGNSEFPLQRLLRFWEDPVVCMMVLGSIAAFIGCLIVVLRLCDERYVDSDVENDTTARDSEEARLSEDPNLAQHAPMRTISAESIERLNEATTAAVNRVRTGRCSQNDAVAYPLACGILSSWAALFSKAFGAEIRHGVERDQTVQFIVLLVLLIFSGLSSFGFINAALLNLDNRYFIPATFAAGTVIGQAQAIFILKEIHNLPEARVIAFCTCICGCILSISMINSKSTDTSSAAETATARQ